jgi:hypothetical protein
VRTVSSSVAATSPALYGLIGYRALQRAAVPEKGRLLLVGFGSSAHIVIQIALHRGHEVSVVTRGENHIRQARELGAAWAGSDFRDLPGKAEEAVLFAPSGNHRVISAENSKKHLIQEKNERGDCAQGTEGDRGKRHQVHWLIPFTVLGFRSCSQSRGRDRSKGRSGFSRFCWGTTASRIS